MYAKGFHRASLEAVMIAVLLRGIKLIGISSFEYP